MSRDALVLFGGLSSQLDTMFLELVERERLVPLVVDLPALPALAAARRRAAALPEECLLIEPAELPRLFQTLHAWSRRFRIAGVYNTLEAFVEPAALVCDLLGVPGPGLRAARVCRNKLLQRVYCAAASPPFVSFLAQAPIPPFEHYPAILKPAGRRGGSGVVRVAGQAEVGDHLHGYHPDEVLLLEQYLAGRDFSVETLIQRGRVLFEQVTEEHEDPAGRANLELGYTLPPISLAPEVLERAYELNRRVVAQLRFEDGILHAEYKVTADGQIYLIEAAARNPGDGLLALYHLATGRPMEAAILDIALGRPAGYTRPTRYARQVYLESPPGVLEDVEVTGFPVAPRYPDAEPARRRTPGTPGTPGAEAHGLREIRMEKARGEAITRLEQADDRVGSVIFDADSASELEALERRVLANVKLIVARTD